MDNYDPNIARNVKNKHVIELTFQSWDFKKTMRVEIGGNCLGLHLDTALMLAYDELEVINGIVCLDLLNDTGDFLECSDDEDREVAWLEEYLVKAEVIEIKPE